MSDDIGDPGMPSKKPTMSEIRALVKEAQSDVDSNNCYKLRHEGAPYLLDLVERMGKALEHLLSQSEIAEFNNMAGTATCELCSQVGPTVATIPHSADCAVKEARALLEELKL